jgi:hypothetical protein
MNKIKKRKQKKMFRAVGLQQKGVERRESVVWSYAVQMEQ